MSNHFSFPSYVIPGTYSENVEFIKKNSDIRHVELLFFLYNKDAKNSIKNELPKLFSSYSDFTFSMHLPSCIKKEHEEIIENTYKNVEYYIVHPPKKPSQIENFVSLFKTFQNKYGNVFLLENSSDGLFEIAEKAILDSQPQAKCPVCADIGHLLMNKIEIIPWLNKRKERIKEIHIHNYDGLHDHKIITNNCIWLNELRQFLDKVELNIEIEVFSFEEATKSLEAIKQALL